MKQSNQKQKKKIFFIFDREGTKVLPLELTVY